MPNNKTSRFIEWFTYVEDTIEGKSKAKAYTLFESFLLDSIEVEMVKEFNRLTHICIVDYTTLPDRSIP